MSARPSPGAYPSTFSIVAADLEVGEIGVATQSKFLCVGVVVPWARAGVGAVATQAHAEVSFGVRGLALLEAGRSPEQVVDELLKDDDGRGSRQFGLVDAQGRAASYTGPDCFEHAGSIVGPGYACQGNILASADVVPSMTRAFNASAGRPLADRLIAALRAGQAAGGDRRGQESAALLVVKSNGGYGGYNDRYIDLRVDHHDTPIEELAFLLDLHRLYFQRPLPSELLTVDAELEAEISSLLQRLGKWTGDTDLWQALEAYMGWENLEERWGGTGRIDPKVLAYLREHAEQEG